MKNFEQQALDTGLATLRKEIGQQPEDPYTHRTLSQLLALALRRLMVSWVREDKPYLVGAADADAVRCFGGYVLSKSKNGVGVTLYCDNKVQNIQGLGMHDIALRLTNNATTAVRQLYRQRMDAFMGQVWAKFEQEAAFTPEMDERLSHWFYSHLDWLMDGSMEVRWWGRQANVPALSKLILKQAWAKGLLDRKVWGLTIRVYGMKAALSDYNLVAANRAEVEARIAEAPNMAPLMCPTREDQYDTSSNLLDASPNGLATRRDQLLSSGLTPMGWRWLTKQSRYWVHQIHRLRTVEQVDLLNLMASHQVGRLPINLLRIGTLTTWTSPDDYQWRHGKISRDDHRQSMALLLKAVLQAIHKRQVLARDAREQIGLILDFVRDGYPIKKGATWQSLLRRQEEWHAAAHRRRIEEMKAERDRMPAYEWTPIVSDVQYKEVRAISLTNSDALWAEGDTLEHCVGTYGDHCFRNRSRIFSMRTPENEALATLEVILEDGKWRIAQLRGRRNAVVKDDMVQALAKQVLTKVRRSPLPKQEANRVLREGTHPYYRHRPARPLPDFLEEDPEHDVIPF